MDGVLPACVEVFMATFRRWEGGTLSKGQEVADQVGD